MTFKSIQVFINSLFVFHLKESLRRNDQNLKKNKKIALKGQMSIVNGGNSILYMSSPDITTISSLSDATFYLNDLPLHNATRDLIMLNTTRISQQDLK